MYRSKNKVNKKRCVQLSKGLGKPQLIEYISGSAFSLQLTMVAVSINKHIKAEATENFVAAHDKRTYFIVEQISQT